MGKNYPLHVRPTYPPNDRHHFSPDIKYSFPPNVRHYYPPAVRFHYPPNGQNSQDHISNYPADAPMCKQINYPGDRCNSPPSAIGSSNDQKYNKLYYKYGDFFFVGANENDIKNEFKS